MFTFFIKFQKKKNQSFARGIIIEKKKDNVQIFLCFFLFRLA